MTKNNNDCQIHIWIDWMFFNRVTKMVLHIIFLTIGKERKLEKVILLVKECDDSVKKNPILDSVVLIVIIMIKQTVSRIGYFKLIFFKTNFLN